MKLQPQLFGFESLQLGRGPEANMIIANVNSIAWNKKKAVYFPMYLYLSFPSLGHC
jgi:hypothetical protein